MNIFLSSSFFLLFSCLCFNLCGAILQLIFIFLSCKNCSYQSLSSSSTHLSCSCVSLVIKSYVFLPFSISFLSRFCLSFFPNYSPFIFILISLIFFCAIIFAVSSDSTCSGVIAYKVLRENWFFSMSTKSIR